MLTAVIRLYPSRIPASLVVKDGSRVMVRGKFRTIGMAFAAARVFVPAAAIQGYGRQKMAESRVWEIATASGPAHLVARRFGVSPTTVYRLRWRWRRRVHGDG